ncbi:hypothetical protein OROMI_000549 [Orobanche minor]
MSSRKGPPKHQNKFAWKPHGGQTINPTELGGTLRPYSEVTGVCPRCKDQIDWKRKYGKYKPLTEPAKCGVLRGMFDKLITISAMVTLGFFFLYSLSVLGCAKEHNVCAKCSCRVDHIVGRDLSEVEAEQRTLEEAIKNVRERERRSLLRAMNKAKPQPLATTPKNDESKAGELFAAASLQEYAELSRDNEDNYSDVDEPQIIG